MLQLRPFLIKRRERIKAADKNVRALLLYLGRKSSGKANRIENDLQDQPRWRERAETKEA